MILEKGLNINLSSTGTLGSKIFDYRQFNDPLIAK
jgi:hypothetical protein